MTIRGVDERLIWSIGLATIGSISNGSSDVHFFKNRYYLLTLLTLCCSSRLTSNFSMVPHDLTSRHSSNMFLGLLSIRDFPLLKTLVFSLLNTFLNYDCDGKLIPCANNIQKNQYVDRFYKVSIELLLILIQYKPP